MIEPIEELFFKAVKSGNKKKIDTAFEAVYKAYAKLVAFVVGEYISDGETIKEVVNDVFLSLFNHAENVRGSVKYYLSVSAKNAAINRAKSESKRRGDIPIEFAEESVTFEPRSEIISELKKYLREEEVGIILKHVIEGYSFKEIAKSSEKNVNTVLSIYSRAIKKLRKEADLDA